MITYDSQTIILAIIGSVGILGSLVVLLYGFGRNKNGDGKYQ